MSHYVGIDLGTTNSAIATYDGEQTRLWKSPEQADVTPSAILYQKRGNKLIGERAYASAPLSPGGAALLFKRQMGTATPVRIPDAGLTLTPEQCSAEILKVLFGYLPEELRNDSSLGTVITVPAAFNQMQKDATLAAAELAAIGRVTLMQEPVAAIMSVMRVRKTDGIFVVYDLGGGTLDVAVAESIGGRVSLLAHGGIEMCGGRDFDRAILETAVKEWLLSNFDLAADVLADPAYGKLARLAAFHAERAKIRLSARESAERIIVNEEEVGLRDRQGNELYLDIGLDREVLNRLIEPKVEASIGAVRETLKQAGLSAEDIQRLVFVGGPTHYKPLRDRVTAALGIPGSTEVNPMTAVAEGAAVFAESIDWSSQSRGKKSVRGTLAASGTLAVSFVFVSRTPDSRARIAAKLAGDPIPGAEFQIDCLDTGWSSGRLPLRDGATIDVSLAKPGDNTFKVFVYDGAGGPVALNENKLVISRVAATIDGIPASHSVFVEVLDKVGGPPVQDFWIKAGEALPKKEKRTYRAGESVRAGSPGAIYFKIWEGDIADPITHNRFVGALKIVGTDLESGVVNAGEELVCQYELSQSGQLSIEVSIPSLRATFHSGHNFYSRQEAQIDFTKAAPQVAEDAAQTYARIEEVSKKVSDPKLEQAKKKAEEATALPPTGSNPETNKQAYDDVLEARRLLAQVRKEHQREIRQLDLDGARSFFEETVKELARPNEVTSFESLFRTAQKAIDANDRDFDGLLGDIRGRFWEVLWRQEWFVVERFRRLVSKAGAVSDPVQFESLVAAGHQAMKTGDIDRLREVVALMSQLQVRGGDDDDMLASANIMRG